MQKGPTKAFLFLSLIIIWSLTFYLLALILGLIPPENQYELYYLLSKSTSAFTYIRKIFAFADDWTWINLIIAYCIIIILFCISDIFLLKFIPLLRPSPSKNLYTEGFIWICRLTANTFVVLITCIIIAFIVNKTTSKPLILKPEQLQGKYHVLVLGTSKYIHNTNKPNLYYQQRIQTAVWLYKNGYVSQFTLSGDHQGKHYSEPHDMLNDLLLNGVPKSIINLDLTGYRTFDSIKKIKNSSKLNVLVVSQQFHLERALFIAHKNNLKVYGFPASGNMNQAMIQREALAKIKVLLDIYILNTQAFGTQAQQRRNISFFKIQDAILLIFLALVSYLSGVLTKQILSF